MTGEQPKPGSNLVKQLIGVACAGVFLWLAFRGADPARLWSYIKQVQPFYLFLVCVSGLVSHILRAVRWVFLLNPVAHRRVSLWNSFCAVVYGYAVNVVVPRGGEVVRLVAISKSEKLPWVGVLSTMFIDRLLDIAALVLLLGFTLIAVPSPGFADMKWLVPGGIGLSVATLLGLLILPQMASIMKWALALPLVDNKLSSGIKKKIEDLAEQFDTGCRSLKSPVAYPAIAGLSCAIWFFYWLNTYLMVWAFGLAGRVNLSQSLAVFTIGSVGVLVPTPGNVGSFHFLVSQSLQIFSGIDKDLALAFASLLHAMCLVVTTCIPAAVCFVWQNYVNKGKRDVHSAPVTTPPAATQIAND
jgi:uncharacterized protein (TIRG00374 family)